jgi:hypothetical protein
MAAPGYACCRERMARGGGVLSLHLNINAPWLAAYRLPLSISFGKQAVGGGFG